jgi:predicted lactoylglutathione lyase
MPGQLIHIPAYWWYSIKFVKSNTSICVFKYKTYMSTLSISDHLFMRILQRQNTKRVIAKRIVVKEKKNDEKTNDLTVSDENKVNNIDNKDDNINNKPIYNIQDSMATSSILKNDIGSEIVETIKTIETVELKDR